MAGLQTPTGRRRARRRASATGVPTGVSPVRRAAQVVVLAYLTAIAVVTGLLMTGWATRPGQSTGVVTALFTTTSAICVSGLSTVDTATHWTAFGQVVILLAIQVGGLGITTFGALLGLAVSRRLGLRSSLIAQLETNTDTIGGIRRVLREILGYTVVFETAVAAALTVRFRFGYGDGFGRSVWLGVFHSVSAFNNAGFSVFPNSLEDYVTDPYVILPVSLAVVAGGLGFPVLSALRHLGRQPRKWPLHCKITVVWTLGLLVVGTVLLTWFEWSNPATLGPLSTPGKLLAGLFASVTPRSAGFNSIDYGTVRDTTFILTVVLMFVGGGAQSTAGGIKVTSLAVLTHAVVAEARGDGDAEAFGRRIPTTVVRQAVAVIMVALAVTMTASLVLAAVGTDSAEETVFQAVSAASTTGLSLSTTVTNTASQLVLAVLMFLGRLGPVTLAAALALRERKRLYRFPEGRPIVG